MEHVFIEDVDSHEETSKRDNIYTPYPGADEKYDDGSDWRLYNPDKYRDPNWSPDKE